MLAYNQLSLLVPLLLACSLIVNACAAHAVDQDVQDEPDQQEPQEEIVVEEEFDESDPPVGPTTTGRPEEPTTTVSDLDDLESALDGNTTTGSTQRQSQGGLNDLIKKILPPEDKSKTQQQQQQKNPLENFDLKNLGEKMTSVELPTGERISPIDHLFVDIIPQLFDAPPSNQNGTAKEFKELAYKDESNDDAVHLTTVSAGTFDQTDLHNGRR